MKLISYSLALGLFVAMPVLAIDTVQLQVTNDSDTAIVIRKSNGETIHLPPYSYTESEFKDHSYAENYVDNKLVCTWPIEYKHGSGRLFRISYDPQNDKFKCQLHVAM